MEGTQLPTSVTTPQAFTTSEDDSVRIVLFRDLEDRNVRGIEAGERIVGVVPVVCMLAPAHKHDTPSWDSSHLQKTIPLADSAFVLARSGLAKRLAESEEKARVALQNSASQVAEAEGERKKLQDKYNASQQRLEEEKLNSIRHAKRCDELEERRRTTEQKELGPMRRRLKALEQQMGVQKLRELEADGVLEKFP